MKILVACEESQRVTKEFRNKGHEAYSCDILETSGEHQEWHIMENVLPLLHGNCNFKTQDGTEHYVDKWDMIIAFPPCTHLAVSGARHFEKKRADGRQFDGINFFCQFLDLECEKVVIENPVGIMSGTYVLEYFPELARKYKLPRPYTQKIQPYEFGDPFKKTTCLWIKGLPKLKPTNIVEPQLVQYYASDGRVVTFSVDYITNTKDRARIRSKTYPGIAKAMAEQWG